MTLIKGKINKRFAIVAAILVVITGLAWWFGGGGRRINWLETYDADSRDPYGANVIYQLLESYLPGQPLHRLTDSLALPDGAGPPANYVFIGGGLFLDSAETTRLLRFVAAGNQALIASRTIPYELMSELMPSVECPDAFYEWDDYGQLEDTAATLHPPDGADPLRLTYRRGSGVQPYRWQYIDSVFFCAAGQGPTPLGRLNDSLANFVRLPHGRGTFYLHTNPIAFSNIALLDEAALRYADEIFAFLLPGPIYWDEYGKVTETIARRRNQAGNPAISERRLDTQSPLQYVLAQPALTWAWYLLLALALLYLVFRAKRRQRIVPVLETNTNTSLEFLGTIGRLTFLQNDHRELALQQMKLFRAYVRRHYGLHARELDDDFIEKLAGKSEIPATRLRELIARFAEVEQSSRIDADALIGFHQKLDFFYKNCK